MSFYFIVFSFPLKLYFHLIYFHVKKIVKGAQISSKTLYNLKDIDSNPAVKYVRAKKKCLN